MMTRSSDYVTTTEMDAKFGIVEARFTRIEEWVDSIDLELQEAKKLAEERHRSLSNQLASLIQLFGSSGSANTPPPPLITPSTVTLLTSSVTDKTREPTTDDGVQSLSVIEVNVSLSESQLLTEFVKDKTLGSVIDNQETRLKNFDIHVSEGKDTSTSLDVVEQSSVIRKVTGLREFDLTLTLKSKRLLTSNWDISRAPFIDWTTYKSSGDSKLEQQGLELPKEQLSVSVAAGFCAKLLGGFGNGMAQSFINARTLEPSDMKGPKIAADIAKELGKFHKVDIPSSKEPQLWVNIFKFFDTSYTLNFEKPYKQKLFETILFQELHKRIVELKEFTDLINAPVVFAHNALLSGNFMLNEEEEKLYLINFEYGSYNYRGFDIGNHFNENAGYDCDYSLYPSKEEQFHFIKSCLQPDKPNEVNIAEVESKRDEIFGHEDTPSGNEPSVTLSDDTRCQNWPEDHGVNSSPNVQDDCSARSKEVTDINENHASVENAQEENREEKLTFRAQDCVDNQLAENKGGNDADKTDDKVASTCEGFALDASERQTVMAEIERILFYFLPRVPRYVDEKLTEQLQHAEAHVNKKTQSRDALRVDIQKIRATCKDDDISYKETWAEERSVSQVMNSKREHTMQQSTLSLTEEKGFRREIKQLKQLREAAQGSLFIMLENLICNLFSDSQLEDKLSLHPGVVDMPRKA